MPSNRQIQLDNRPAGEARLSNFRRVVRATPPLQDGQVLDAAQPLAAPAESFGPEPTEGELLAATRTRYTLRRVGERAGLVHVHFPRIGFMLKPAPGA
jgi:hypothetical protein